jgi:hypothetical protein
MVILIGLKKASGDPDPVTSLIPSSMLRGTKVPSDEIRHVQGDMAIDTKVPSGCSQADI